MSDRKASQNEGRDRDKVLGLAISQIEKQYGKGAIMRLGSEGVAKNVEVIPEVSDVVGAATFIMDAKDSQIQLFI